MTRRLATTLALLAAPAVAAAQAPRITPKGDPSVNADTIYKLAVKPADFPEERAAFLLDDGVVRFEADGRATRTFRQIVQLLKPEAADDYREQSFSYYPGHQRLTINWVRVVRADGTVISAAPTQVQDSDVPAAMGDPVYSDRKVRRLSLTGVEAGAIVDYSYTLEELKPFLPGDFSEWWGVSTGLRVARSRLVVDVPASLPLRIHEQNLNFARRVTTAGGRTVHTWATRDLPRIKPEAFAADSNGVYMAVMVSSPTTWQDVARWYAGNARGRYAMTPAVTAKLAGVVAGARTLDDSVRAVHRWVAQDVRYLSISLGMGGYQPRAPHDVVATGFGDCKDKATLFVAALAKMGVTAYPVLLNATGGVRRDMPSIGQLDHAIAAVVRPGAPAGAYEFVDLTASLTPYGELPLSEQGEFALVVHPDGRGEEVTLPLDPVDANRTVTRITGTLRPDGSFDGSYEETGSRATQYPLRQLFENRLDSTQRAGIANGVARRYFEGANGDSLASTEGKDLSVQPKATLLMRGGRGAVSSGGGLIFTIPIGGMGRFATAAAELDAAGPRRFPVDAEKVFGPTTALTELRVTLPEGWQARLPASVAAASPFGSYATEYAQVGRELRITRRVAGARGVLPPERAPELARWFREIGKDDAKFIVLEKR